MHGVDKISNNAIREGFICGISLADLFQSYFQNTISEIYHVNDRTKDYELHDSIDVAEGLNNSFLEKFASKEYVL